MNKREIKFRAWNNKIKMMSKSFTFGQVLNFNDQTFKQYTNEEIVMQYTGLKDKKEKEIYEGDITDEGVVIYHPEYLGFFVERNEECVPLYDFAFVEVLGNIYENSSLLK